MEWINHGEKALYTSPWINLHLADVEVPGIRRFNHHLVRVEPAAGTVVRDPARGFLMLWRHRFITDTWGWEIPAGRIDPGETASHAAARETLEESGWRPGPLEPLVRFHPSNGMSDQTFHIFTTNRATHVGEPTDKSEATKVEWLSPEMLRSEISAGNVVDGLTLTSVCYSLALRSDEKPAG